MNVIDKKIAPCGEYSRDEARRIAANVARLDA